MLFCYLLLDAWRKCKILTSYSKYCSLYIVYNAYTTYSDKYIQWHFTQFTIHHTLFTVYSTLRVHFGRTLFELHCTVHTVHYTLYAVQYTPYTIHCTLYSTHRTPYIVRCTVHTVHHTLYGVVYGVYCTAYNVRCTVHTVHYTLYAVQYTPYTIHIMHSYEKADNLHSTMDNFTTLDCLMARFPLTLCVSFHYRMDNVQCTVYSVYYTVYSVECVLYGGGFYLVYTSLSLVPSLYISLSLSL